MAEKTTVIHTRDHKCRLLSGLQWFDILLCICVQLTHTDTQIHRIELERLKQKNKERKRMTFVSKRVVLHH